MRMTFSDTGCRDLDEFGFRTQLIDGTRAAIAHAGPQTTYQLVHEIAERTLVGNPSLDPFRHQFSSSSFHVFCLSITLAGPFHHRSQGPHSTILFECSALVQNRSAWAFCQTCKQSADHHRM